MTEPEQARPVDDLVADLMEAAEWLEDDLPAEIEAPQRLEGDVSLDELDAYCVAVMRRAADEITRLRSQQGDQHSAGWRMVPEEPTPEMVAAWWRQKNNGSQEPGKISLDYRDDYSAYRAMLKAAPSPVPGRGDREEQGASVADSAAHVEVRHGAHSQSEGALVVQRAEDDCTICAIAMATGETYERVMEVAATSVGGYRYQGKPGTMSPKGVLIDLGYEATRIGVEATDLGTLRRWLWGRRAILSVPSINGFEGHHDVYWDGRRVRDPTLKEAYPEGALSLVQPIWAVLLDEVGHSQHGTTPADEAQRMNQDPSEVRGQHGAEGQSEEDEAWNRGVPADERCPECDSPYPELHPATSVGGEVQPCPHPFHGPRSPYLPLAKGEALAGAGEWVTTFPPTKGEAVAAIPPDRSSGGQQPSSSPPLLGREEVIETLKANRHLFVEHQADAILKLIEAHHG